MSSLLDQARARALRPVASLPRPRLTIVPKSAARSARVPFVLLVVTLLAVGLVGLLLLNTALQQGAYTATGLRDQSQALGIRQQNLQMQVAALRQPQRVAQEGLRLGMVQNDSPAFLSLSNGRIIGTPMAGEAAKKVDVTTSADGGAAHASKERPLPAGAKNSLATAPVTVPAHRAARPAHQNQPRKGQRQ